MYTAEYVVNLIAPVDIVLLCTGGAPEVVTPHH
jgi:hypothetical protein